MYNKIAGRVLGFVALGLFSSAFANPKITEPDELPCLHVKGSKKGRPRAFHPHHGTAAAGNGFAVRGNFPGALLDEGGCSSPEGTEPALPGDAERRNFNFRVGHVYHPPLSPEERQELADLISKCPADGKPNKSFLGVHKYRMDLLKEKHRKFDEVFREMQIWFTVGQNHQYVSTSFTMTAEVLLQWNVPGEVITITDKDMVNWPHPWRRFLRPISIQAELKPHYAPKGVTLQNATICLKFDSKAGPYVGYGSFAQEGEVPWYIMTYAGWCGRQGRPAWHPWCKPGKEDKGEWNLDEDIIGELNDKKARMIIEAEEAAKKAKDAQDALDKVKKDLEEAEAKKKAEDAKKGNNGVGNGTDPQPPGDPKPNDTAGTSPGNPGSQGGNGGGGGNDKK